MTWDELLEHMDNLVAWGQDSLKGWRKQASALQESKHTNNEQACVSADLKHRMQVQNKLAGICEEMCKEVNAYPKCAQCPDFVEPDSTPGVMTWDELLEHMDNLVAWGQDSLKGWHKQASALQENKHTPLAAVEQTFSIVSRCRTSWRASVRRCARRSMPIPSARSALTSQARFYTRCDDLERVARAHGQLGCLGPGQPEGLAQAGIRSSDSEVMVIPVQE